MTEFISILLRDYEDSYEPPEAPVLRLAESDDKVFIGIGKVDSKAQGFDSQAQVAVELGDLMDAVWVLWRARLRADARRVGSTTREGER